ncbi:MAG: hypothetical protein COA74_04600 [Gammaproteobacteria bacterium]|nr:MAG: hypothetical protein COA74_04600 [Gammaproteobacteria bacterium]
MKLQEIITFWFETIEPKLWWVKDEKFDQLLRDKFLDIHLKACQGELVHWRTTAQGRLAEIIILDQFSRNIFRDTPRAFAQDAMALVLAQEAINVGANEQLIGKQKAFLYLPFMHSESLFIHDLAVELFNEPGLEGNKQFEKQHRLIIERFGRYPHRNEILNRQSSKQEKEFLTQPGSSF